MLFEINVMILKRIIVNLNARTLTINSCWKLTIDFKITSKNNIRVRRVLKASRKTIIDVNTIIELSICSLQFLLDKDYLFESKLVDAYAYIVDFNVSFIYVCNTSLVLMIIDRHVNLGYLTKYKKQSCYQIGVKEHPWATKEKIQVDMSKNGC